MLASAPAASARFLRGVGGEPLWAMRSQAGRARRRYERNVFIQCWPSAAAGPGAALGGGAAAATMGGT